MNMQPITFGDKFVTELILAKLEICERSLPSKLSIVIDNLVPQNAAEPVPDGRATGETPKASERGKKCLLQEILGNFRLSNANQCMSIKKVTVLVHPVIRILGREK